MSKPSKHLYVIERTSTIFGESVRSIYNMDVPQPARHSFCHDAVDYPRPSNCRHHHREKETDLGSSLKRSVHVILSPVESAAILTVPPPLAPVWIRWSTPALGNYSDRFCDTIKIRSPSWGEKKFDDITPV